MMRTTCWPNSQTPVFSIATSQRDFIPHKEIWSLKKTKASMEDISSTEVGNPSFNPKLSVAIRTTCLLHFFLAFLSAQSKISKQGVWAGGVPMGVGIV